MGEAFLTKALGFAPHDPLDDVVILDGYCSILTTVRDSRGRKIPNCVVNCKDGSTWYNYTTNEEGMVLFTSNSGAANITAYNYSTKDGYTMIDQAPNSIDVDAPIGTKLHQEIYLNEVNSFFITSSLTNQKFQVMEHIDKVQILGGGASGGFYDTYPDFFSNSKIFNGGGGGAYNEITNVQVSNQGLYNFTIASGGSGNAKAGGTTSAFGISAVGGSGRIGGGSGAYKGGDGGIGNTTGTISSISNFSALKLTRATASNYGNNNFPYGGGGQYGVPYYGEDINVQYPPTTNLNYLIWRNNTSYRYIHTGINLPAYYGGGNPAVISTVATWCNYFRYDNWSWINYSYYRLNSGATGGSYGSGGCGGFEGYPFSQTLNWSTAGGGGLVKFTAFYNET